MFNNTFSGKKIIVTGHTGFKGAWLSLWLHKLGAEVVGISNEVPTMPSLFEAANLSQYIKDIRSDIRDFESLKKVFIEEKPDFVFHLAAQPIVSLSYSEPLNTFSTNIMGTAHVLEALRSLKNDCVSVIVTSDKCYDNVEWEWGYKETDHLGGKDIYSGSKGGAEIVFKSYFHSFLKKMNNHRIATARAGNVIGGGDWAIDRIVPDCIKAWSRKETVEIRSPNATRPWQHVLEPLSGYLNLAQHLKNNSDLNGASFNFGPKSEYSHSVEKLLKDLSIRWNFNTTKEVYKLTGDIKFHEAGLLKLNCDKALFHLKWLPALDYDQLVEFTSLWYYEFYNGNADVLKITLEQIQEYENIAKSKLIKWTC
jgi:CDP-glucose 4,6-dehydratase